MATLAEVLAHTSWFITRLESGWGQWTDGGSDCYRQYEPNTAATGNYCIRLRDNSGKSSSLISKNLNFNGVQECKVDFMYIAESMEYGEDFMVEYSTNGGDSYTTVKQWKAGQDFNNGQKKSASVKFSGNFNNNVKIRFRCDASSNYDMIYLDEINVYACGGSWLNDDNNNSSNASLSTVVATQLESISNEDNSVIEAGTIGNPTVQNDSELIVFPNPSSHTLNIHGLSGQTYDVYDVTGMKVIKSASQDLLNLSGLQNGTYLLRTVDGQMIRFIKI